MGFIELFFKDKKEIKETDIRLFISQRIEESVNLDYKARARFPKAIMLPACLPIIGITKG
jgi:hypothetical protein